MNYRDQGGPGSWGPLIVLFRGGRANWGTGRVHQEDQKAPAAEITLAQKRIKEMMK
jgi:hypothetical protein